MGPEITNLEHRMHTSILSRQLIMKCNTRDNMINRERSKPRWGKLARKPVCQRKVYSRHANKITHIQVNIPTVLVSLLSY